jgi:hypothetical protein
MMIDGRHLESFAPISNIVALAMPPTTGSQIPFVTSRTASTTQFRAHGHCLESIRAGIFAVAASSLAFSTLRKRVPIFKRGTDDGRSNDLG